MRDLHVTGVSGVSLIMATLGRVDEVARMVESLLLQTDKRFELIIVDQNPDARLCSLVEQAIASGIRVKHLRLERCGLSAARNHGLAFAEYELVAFPDDDCWYEPEVVGAAMTAFSSDVDAVVGHWVERGDVVRDGTALSLAEWKRFRTVTASSITVFLRTRLVRSVGGFDERLGVGAWFGAAEETDLLLRALMREALIVHASSLRIHHAYSTNRIAKWQQVRRRERGTGALYRKHFFPLHVILRGCIGPMVRPILAGKPREIYLGTGVCCGRLEGLLRWPRGSER